MPVLLVPLHEYNPCHNPEGPGGGQFCAGPDGYADGLPPPVRQLQKVLMELSFTETTRGPHETMGIMDLKTGAPVGQLLRGGEDYVDTPKELQQAWIAHPGQILTAHTHPGSAPFSFDDFELHNSVNQQAGAVKVAKMQVYGEDGSWYELTFPRVYSNQEVADLRRLFDYQLEVAAMNAGNRTDAWAKQRDWWTRRPPKTWDLMTEREHIRHAAEKAGQLDTLTAVHRQHFKEATGVIWPLLARRYERFGFGYRQYQAPARTN